MRYTLLIALLVSVIAPGSAQAGWKIDRAKLIAGVVWHHPCDDQIQVRFTAVEDEVAWTAAEESPCTVFLGADTPRAWMPLCHTILHEVGHLAGAEHSRNPHSVMYPYINQDELVTPHGVRWLGVDRRCRERGRPYLADVRGL